jgi:hypothetical protein
MNSLRDVVFEILGQFSRFDISEAGRAVARSDNREVVAEVAAELNLPPDTALNFQTGVPAHWRIDEKMCLMVKDRIRSGFVVPFEDELPDAVTHDELLKATGVLGRAAGAVALAVAATAPADDRHWSAAEGTAWRSCRIEPGWRTVEIDGLVDAAKLALLEYVKTACKWNLQIDRAA